MAGLTALKKVTEPLLPIIKSPTEEVIKKLPEDFVMKENLIPQHLKDIAAPLKVPGVKDEELKFANIFNPDSEQLLTKKELMERVLNREDVFSRTILNDQDATVAPRSTLPQYKSHNYQEAGGKRGRDTVYQ